MVRLGKVLRLAETEGLPYEVDEDGPNARHAPKPENRCVKLDQFATSAIRLLLLTGCRLREILHLEWAHVDLERGMLLLSDSKTGKKAVILGPLVLEILAGLPRVGRFVIAGASASSKDETPRADLKRAWIRIRNAAGSPTFGFTIYGIHTPVSGPALAWGSRSSALCSGTSRVRRRSATRTLQTIRCAAPLSVSLAKSP
jgi:integrase